MVKRTPEIIICLMIVITVGVAYVITQTIKLFLEDPILTKGSPLTSTTTTTKLNDNWVFRLSLNLIGYSTIILPGYLIFRYTKSCKYVERAGSGLFPSLIRLCFAHSDLDKPADDNTQLANQPRTFLKEFGLLVVCFVGLQSTYLTWGVLQEKIMTQEYEDIHGNKAYFRDSQFLVFVNRILAFLLSGTYILITRQPRHTAPLYKYVYCSFSNVMSSWCQYEALKYISFPTQVLAKASKIIPVMIMGKIVSKKKYDYYEYITAVFMSIGMFMFLVGSDSSKHADHITTFSGIFLLVAYMLFDSFTSNWQGELFSQHHMSSVQMMCGVNLFSCLFTAVSLAQQGGFIHSLNFMTQYYKFIFDCIVLSVCSAAGQLFIFFTISTFGAVTFVIIMTIRQCLAILLSCLIYHHNITALGVFGIAVVFISLFLSIYCRQRLKTIRRRIQNNTNFKV